MKYIIIDHSINQFLGNRILDIPFAKKFPGISIFPIFAEKAKQHGWQTITADIFLRDVKIFETAICLSNEITAELPNLLKMGVIPGLLISGESPNIIRNFYKNLPETSKLFKHAYLFRGSLVRLSPTCEGHHFYWPCPSNINVEDIPLNSRYLLGMVASYKSNYIGGIRNKSKAFLNDLKWKYYKSSDKTLNFNDLYEFRLKFVESFASNPDFKLTGNGWEHAMSNVYRIRKIKFSNKPYVCEDKLITLGELRFALIVENCVYPGYITEKIFDAFRAGTVPVYLGAPDILDFVPVNCFIDYRKFNSEYDLWEELQTISEIEWRQYRIAINNFLKSVRYENYLEEHVADRWLEWLEQSSNF